MNPKSKFPDFTNYLDIDDPIELADFAILSIVEFSKALNCDVYILNTLNNKLELDYSYAESSKNLSEISLDGSQDTFDEVIAFNKRIPIQTASEIIIPILKKVNSLLEEKIVIGLIKLECQNAISSEQLSELQSIVHIFNLVNEKQFLNNLLSVANQPISFRQAQNDYFLEVLDLIANASKFPFIVLREFNLEQESLEVVRHNGSSQFPIPPNFFKESMPEAFKKVITLKKTFQSSFNNGEKILEDLANEGFKKYIVLPVSVGDEFWGTLSLGTKSEYIFNLTEILALETIAHGIGVSITNFRSFHQAHQKVGELDKSAILISGIEIAQAVRHEARNLLNESQLKLKRLYKQFSSKDSDNLFESVSDKLKNIDLSLDKIRTVTKPPEKVLKKVYLDEVWLEAVDMVQGRVHELNVSIKRSGPLHIQVSVFPDWLRHAFLNLLMNSLDAFRDKRTKKTKREISISIDPSSINDKYYKLIYGDNAGGIEVNNLSIPESMDENIKDDITRLIFEPNVTSKGEKGSGYGLYLTRITIQEHHKGSIDLVNYRGGITFSIQLPKEI